MLGLESRHRTVLSPFFFLLKLLPSRVVGIILVMAVSLSTAAFDSFQSAMVSTESNDLFRNKLNNWWIRTAVMVIIFPIAVVSLRGLDTLQVYLNLTFPALVSFLHLTLG